MYLETILQLRYQGILGDEVEKHALPREGHWDDQGHEESHLKHEQQKDLLKRLANREHERDSTSWSYKTVVERHGGGSATSADVVSEIGAVDTELCECQDRK